MSAVLEAEHYAMAHRVTDAQLRDYVPTAADHSIRSLLDFTSEVAQLLHGKDETAGDSLPWPKTHGSFRFLPGEVTLWHGINGHGKSALTTQVALWLALQNRKSCIASFEMLPARTIVRMVKQAAGSAMPSDAFASNFMLGLCQRIWLYDHRGQVDPEMLFRAIRYCAEVKGTSHFWIDSLMKCVRGSDDYNGQKDFVSGICDIAHETNTHIHLIHHVRKGESEDRVPNKFDARGAGEITDQVDNVLAVWRNKKKERERDEAVKIGVELVNETPDFLLICDKNRNGGWEGNWALWGDVTCWHFRETAKRGWTSGYQIPGYERRQDEPGANG